MIKGWVFFSRKSHTLYFSQFKSGEFSSHVLFSGTLKLHKASTFYFLFAFAHLVPCHCMAVSSSQTHAVWVRFYSVQIEHYSNYSRVAGAQASHLQLWMCEQTRRQIFSDNRISIGRFNSFISPTHKTSIVLVLAGIFLSNQISLKNLENCYLCVNVIKLILQLFIIWAIKIQNLNQSCYK